ncbi:MAG: hypothetical protein R2684_10995 [Pyrinomonadaceae bacterium]
MSFGFKRLFWTAMLGALLAFGINSKAYAQSSDQNNPTYVTGSEISAQIKARGIGDSRLTSHFYLFEGRQGDLFINIVTSNLNGTIDVFELNGLKPRTRVTLFADNPDGETGRVVYMRESTKLLLRIQGRTPNDDPARYQIKFAGTFAVLEKGVGDDEAPQVVNAPNGNVRVNSVGAIIEVPKPQKDPAAETIAATQTENSKTESKIAPSTPQTADVSSRPPEKHSIKTEEVSAGRIASAESNANRNKRPKDSENAKETVANNNVATAEKTQANEIGEVSGNVEAPSRDLTVEVVTERPRRSALVTISREPNEEKSSESETKSSETVEKASELTLEQKLAMIQLKVLMKDGTAFVRPMSEVKSVNVLKGILTIVTAEGKLIEFSILEVADMTIGPQNQ